jgi:hypothetical protein
VPWKNTRVNTRLALVIGSVVISGACSTNNSHSDMTPTPIDMSGGGVVIEGQHGTVIDYFTSMPLAGFTVSDGTKSTKTDAQGNWVLPAQVGELLAPTVTGPDYSQLYLPEAMAAGVDADRGVVPIPSTSSLGLGQMILSNDTSKAVVYLTLIPTGGCKSIAGGTLTVNAPAGTSVAYFTPQGLPTGTAFADVDSARNKPAAVIFNLEPGADVDVTINHPTCTPAPRGTVIKGLAFTGKVQTPAIDPGNNNSSLAMVLQ